MNIKINYIYNTCYQLFTVLLPLVTVPYVSRVLGVEGVGKYAYTSSYTQYFILLGMLGITLYGRREIAYVKSDKETLNKTFSNIYFLQIATTSLAYILYIIFFVVINKTERMLYLVNSLLILGATFDICWFFIGIEHLKSVVIRNFIVRISALLAIFIFVKDNNDLLIYAIIMALNILIGQIIMWFSIKGKVKLVRPTFKGIKIHAYQASRLFVSQIAIQIYIVLDRTMLGIISDNSQVGLYDNSQKIIKTILALVTSIAVIMLPRMSTLFADNNMEEFKKMLNKVLCYINFLGIPIMVGVMAIAREFSIWFYGEQFQGIEELLIIGSVIIIAISWSNVLGMQVMIPMKKEKEFTISVTIGAVANFILNLFLIKKLGAMGSTLSTVIAELTVALVQLYFLRNVVDIRYALTTFYKPIMCVIPMYICVKLMIRILPINIIGTGLSVLVGVGVYLGLAYLLKHELMMEGIKEIKQKLKRRKCLNE